jgi:hypothetical protein
MLPKLGGLKQPSFQIDMSDFLVLTICCEQLPSEEGPLAAYMLVVTHEKS